MDGFVERVKVLKVLPAISTAARSAESSATSAIAISAEAASRSATFSLLAFLLGLEAFSHRLQFLRNLLLRFLEDRYEFGSRAPVGASEEAQAGAATVGSARASDAMNVLFDVARKVVVHDVRDVLDVDAAAGDVGGNENADLSAFDVGQRLLSVALLAISVDALAVDAAEHKVAAQAVRAVLLAAEDDGLVGRLHLLREAEDPVVLLLLVHELDDLCHGVSGGQVQTADDDLERVVHVAGCQSADASRPGSRRHHRLSVRADVKQQFADLRLEAHVEHAVGFVQNQVGDRLNLDVTSGDQIIQATRRGDDDFNSAFDDFDLLFAIVAAIQANAGKISKFE